MTGDNRMIPGLRMTGVRMTHGMPSGTMSLTTKTPLLSTAKTTGKKRTGIKIKTTGGKMKKPGILNGTKPVSQLLCAVKVGKKSRPTTANSWVSTLMRGPSTVMILATLTSSLALTMKTKALSPWIAPPI
jgi:hypothetical protein